MRLVLVQPQLDHSEAADNIATVSNTLAQAGITPHADDVLLLPERVMMTHARATYARAIADLARSLGCTVVGGSHHEARGDQLVNAGLAVGPDGAVRGEYEKVRPYASERAAVRGGAAPGEFVIAGRRFMVLICADFWFSDLFHQAEHLPDVVLVPALSVSRKPTPDYSRSLWRHLAIARAYEMGTYVGVSDWGHPSKLPALFTSGVGGLADPTETDAAHLFRPIDAAGASAYALDFERLAHFRQDRIDRGFFWKRESG
ncbi:MAG: carbon-nitrogen hydrolase family protein [Polyangiaceae bacterium]|nr:carbon-nitrogen hydrolase family protein [Polyangiaceae bacterium]